MAFTGGAYTLGWGVNADTYTTYLETPSTATYAWSMSFYNASAYTYYFQARYIQASPPYDLGYGEIPLFMFATIDKNSGKVSRLDLALDAPWHYNGPTNIKADVYKDNNSFKYIKPVETELLNEGISLIDMSHSNRRAYLARLRDEKPELISLSQNIKNADIDIVPHPFLGDDLSSKIVVLLHPCCDECLDVLALREQGEKIDINFANKYLKIENSALSVRSPKGVLTVGFKWKNTK